MFGSTAGELANLLTARSVNQLILSACIILTMWPATPARVTWAVSLACQLVAIFALSTAMALNSPAHVLIYGLLTSLGIGAKHASLRRFSGRAVPAWSIVVPPVLVTALAIVAQRSLLGSLVAVHLVLGAQFVLLAGVGWRIERQAVRIGGRVLLCGGAAISGAAMLGFSGLMSALPMRFVDLAGFTALATAAGFIMQNMGWLAMQKDSAEIKLERLANIDGLTGVPNRRGFLEASEGVLARARQQGQAVSLLLLDLDHFKSINDRWGHETGDQVLSTLGQLLQAHRGEHGVPVRLGGEEFGLLLVGVEPVAAHAVSEALRSALEGAVRLPDGAAVRFSAGVARVGGAGVEAALMRADKALYEAKASGRDCAVISRDGPDALAA